MSQESIERALRQARYFSERQALLKALYKTSGQAETSPEAEGESARKANSPRVIRQNREPAGEQPQPAAVAGTVSA